MHAAKTHIEEHERRRHLVEARERLFGRRRDHRVVAKIANRLGKSRRKTSIVCNDQDFGHGSSISKSAPFLLSIQRREPPCASAISRAMVSPSPAPSPRVLT